MITEAIVSFVLQKLGDLLVDGVFLHEVHDQLEWVEEELKWMQAFLKDAKMKQNDARVKKRVDAVRDIAYKAEDIIDNFILQVGGTSFVDQPSARHQLGKKIEEIKNELLQIRQRRKTYGIKNLGQGREGSSSMSESLREQRQTSPLLEDTEIIGFQEDIKTLVERLIKGESRRCVISIVGMGGLGKTALARKVYNHDAVKKHFHCCAWIYVSQEYDARDLLQNTMRCLLILTIEHHQMNIVQLKEKLFEHLKARRYFVVVDDIWKTGAWNVLAAAFPDMNNGSRVLFTTRNREVALFADAQSCLHELQLLGKDESWKLFCKKTFLEQDSNCPTNLERLVKEIVAKSHSLPLAVVVIGGLLSTKARLPSEWEKVLKSLSWQFVEGQPQISSILALSYEDLPYHLKPCFLYLGVYPEDLEFSARELIWFWVAEGFVHSRGAETMEEVAEDCLEELIQRSLIQMVKRSSIRAVKSCCIQDLLRDLSILKAKEENFLDINSGGTNSPSPCKARRLAVHHGTCKYTCFKNFTDCLRSIIWFCLKEDFHVWNQNEFVFGGVKLLRVLHLHDMRVEEVPNEIGMLIHLRYLGVMGFMTITSLPSSIANLCNLQTLNVTLPPGSRSTIPFKIPSDIWKMQHLRHVHIVEGKFTGEGSNAGRLTANELSFPSNLQTLNLICADDWIENCLGKLINLRKLGIVEVDLRRHGKGLLDSIPKLDHLQSLTLHGENLNPFPPILNRPRLYELRLDGKLEKLPESHEFSPNLTKLTLAFTKLVQDPMTTLEKLLNLRILKLHPFSYVGKEMVCSAQGFPRLEILELTDLFDLKEWRIEEGAMMNLLSLYINRCTQLKMLPEELQHVTSLRKLEVTRMSWRFIASTRQGRRLA